ncbi:MAG TPA: molybdopterin cofactor-binding domain-containing protein [Methylomirabilota bacterium]|jgi:CO/xanthine dehydrogenase Mo-binding subunit|nr:molybdopterin cofactor-binding domain-containing protein [Methylomirabilota bacterium]
MAADRLTVVGRSVPRLDARDKVTGAARYVSDLVLPGMAHAKLWRSPVAHARIIRVETERAAAVSGVLAVLTVADLPVKRLYYGPAYRDQPILAHEVIRYAGEPVVAVVADSEAHAEAALAHVDVRYDERPAATSAEEALAPGAPLIHPKLDRAGHFRDLSGLRPVPGTNICQHFEYERGDLARAFGEADLVVEDVYRYPALSHHALEAHCAVARVDADGLTVWAGTQHPFPVRKDLAEIFDLPLAAVQVVVPLVGGAFGGKCYTKIEPLVAALATKVRKPVRLALSLEESARTITRHAVTVRLRTAVGRDGTLLARQCEVVLDTGAYADIGPRVATKTGYRAPGPYRIPSLRIDSKCVYTNNVPAGAYRGYGVPQVTWACESQMDVIAERLDIDPLALRRKNLLKRGEEYVAGDTPMDGDMAEGLEQTARAVGWSAPLARGRGRGLACAMKDGGGTHTVSTAVVRINADGSVALLAGSVEVGQGARTALAQVVAETLGVPFETVVVVPPDTSITPYDHGTSASRSTTVMGLAVEAAARDAREQLLALAAKLLDTDASALAVGDGTITHGDRRLTVAEVISGHYGLVGGEVTGVGSFVPGKWSGTLGGATVFWETGMGAAEIEVDPETGAVKVVKYVSAADVGQAINPRECAAQDEGAAMQGIGPALFESRVSERGQLLNPGLIDYRVPAFTDLPGELDSLLIENADGPGPFGAKGVGEGGTFCAAPAIGNALARATGVRLTELPMTPERVWRALRAAGRVENP